MPVAAEPLQAPQAMLARCLAPVWRAGLRAKAAAAEAARLRAEARAAQPAEGQDRRAPVAAAGRAGVNPGHVA